MSLPALRSPGATGPCAAVCLALLISSGILFGCARHVAGLRPAARISVQPAQAQGAQSTPSRPPTPLTVNVDTTRVMPADPAALASALEGTPLAQAVAGPIPDRAAPPDWLVWGHLNAGRAPYALSAPITFAPNGLGLYAANYFSGKTVCLINRSQEKLQARVQVRLPRGIYTIERLTLRLDDRNETAMAVPGADAGRNGPRMVGANDDTTAATVAPAFRLDRLQGCDLRRAALVAKTGMLEPGQVVFYRFTDQSRAVDAAYADTYQLLATLERNHPGPAHRLRRMLREGDPYRGGARPGGREVGARLESIHQLLLVTAQAQSLHRNYQARGTVEAEIGAALMGSLERVMDGLAEVSATLLDLVPQISIETEPGKPAVGNNDAAAVPAVQAADSSVVTVALANGGEHSVEMVKLGLDSSELPASIVCAPSDPAFFGTLKPGQTVRATFRLRCPSGVNVIGRRCVADVCYRAGGGPAHLRPRPW